MPSDNPLSFSQLKSWLDPYYEYRIWKAPTNTGDSQEVGKFDGFYEAAFDDFIPGSGFSCAVLCDGSQDYLVSQKVYTKLFPDLSVSENVPIHPKKLIKGAKTTYDSIINACDKYLDSGIIDDDTEVIFHIASNVVFCKFEPKIDKPETLLEQFRDTVRFGLILPFLCKSVENVAVRDEYIRLANSFGKAEWSDIDYDNVIKDLQRITANAERNLAHTFPRNWCLLISLPEKAFDTILSSRVQGEHPYVGRIIQVNKHGDKLVTAIADAISNREKIREIIAELEKITVNDAALRIIYTAIDNVFNDNKTNHLGLD